MTSMKNGPILLLLLYYNIFWRIRWAIAQDGGLLCPEGGPVLDSFGMPGRCDAVNPRCPAMSFCYANRLLMDGRRYYCCPVPKGPRVLIAPPGTIVQPASMDGVQNYLITIAVGPGGPCDIDAECGGGAMCMGGVCLCPPGTLTTMSACAVMPPAEASVEVTVYANPGDPCANNGFCAGGAFCHQQVCTCPPKYVVVENQCVIQTSQSVGGPPPGPMGGPFGGPPPGGPFGDPRGGPPGGPFSHPPGPMGGPPPGSMIGSASSFSSMTTLYASPGDPCRNGAVCTGGSYCHQYVCTCPPSSVIESKICVPSNSILPRSAQLPITTIYANPGEPCGNGRAVCAGGSYCFQFLCICPPNNIVDMNQCIPNPTQTQITIYADPGQPCGNGGAVCSGGSYCLQYVCTCPPQHIIDSNVCIPLKTTFMNQPDNIAKIFIPPGAGPLDINVVANPGEPCVPTTVCQGGSYCLRGFCACPGNTMNQNNMCLPMPSTLSPSSGFPQPLPIPVMTLPPSSPGFVREARSNITANPGQSCANGEICIGFSLCNDEVCKCPVQCGNGPCIISNNQCVPMPTGGPNGGGYDGLTSAPSPPYDPMEPFSPGDGKTAGPFQSCSSGEICVGGSYCLSGVCTCPPGNYIQDGRCVTVINQNQSVGGFGSVPTSGHYIGATGLMPVPSAPGIVLNASGVAPSASAVVPRTVGGPPPPHHLDSEAQYQQYTDTTYTTSPTTETTTTSTTTITTTSPWYANLWRTEMPPIEDKTKPPGWNRLIREQIFGSIVNGPPSAENVEDSGGEAAFGVGPKGTPLGQRCVTTEQCAGSAFCVGGVCQCAAGDMQIGDFCVSTRQLTKMFSNESTRDSRSFWRTRRRRRRSSEQQ